MPTSCPISDRGIQHVLLELRRNKSVMNQDVFTAIITIQLSDVMLLRNNSDALKQIDESDDGRLNGLWAA